MLSVPRLLQMAIASLGAPFIAFSITPAFAQFRPGGQQGRPQGALEAPLLQTARCTSATTHPNISKPLAIDASDISVNRQLYSSQFRLFSPTKHSSTLTCRAEADKYPVLVLRMGVPDQDTGLNSLETVNIYQKGSVKFTYSNVVPGSLIDVTLRMDEGDNFAVEMICQRAGRSDNYVNRCNLNFLEAKLYITDGSGSVTIPVGSESTSTSNGGQPSNTVMASGKHTPPNSGVGQAGSVVQGVKNTGEVVRGAEDAIRRIRNIFR